MLIPVTFKNNDTETVKTKVGKVSTQTARMLYANTFSDKVGIVKGYKKDDSTEELSLVSATPVGDEMMLTFNKGAVSIYGGIGIIEQGTTVNVPQNITDYSFGIVVNLGNQAGNEMKFYCKPSGELRQDDLQINDVDGVYEFELFKITTTASTVSVNSKTTKYIYSVKDYVEEKLARLGFKQGSITFNENCGASYSLYRHGNVCLLNISNITYSILGNQLNQLKEFSESSRKINFGTLPEEFRPENEVYGYLYLGHIDYGQQILSDLYRVVVEVAPLITITPSGEISVTCCDNIVEYRNSPYAPQLRYNLDRQSLSLGYKAKQV